MFLMFQCNNYYACLFKFEHRIINTVLITLLNKTLESFQCFYSKKNIALKSKPYIQQKQANTLVLTILQQKKRIRITSVYPSCTFAG